VPRFPLVLVGLLVALSATEVPARGLGLGSVDGRAGANLARWQQEAAATAVEPSVVFAAAGDHGANSRAAASLSALDRSGAAFYLALGDLDYDQTPTDEAWCDYVKARLPTLGPTFPFQLVAGNHEDDFGPDGYILNHAACLPDRLDSTPSPYGRYATEYYFDYPAEDPLMRVIMTSPGLRVENVNYRYTEDSQHYQWLAGVIDEARAQGIPWVVVGMHKICLSAGSKSCEVGTDLTNLLIEKRVDLVLQAHAHNYQRSKQLRLSAETCPEVTADAYDPDCVVDEGSDGIYTSGAGAVFVIDGSFGQPLHVIDPADVDAPYFAKTDASTWGFTRYRVTRDRIDADFVNSSGSFSDGFTIAGSTPALPTCQRGQYQAQYFNNKVLLGLPIVARCEGPIDHMWGHGGPGSGVNTDNFSARWVGTHAFPGGTYTFTARTDDGIRVWVDGTLLIDAWKNQPATTYTATRTLSPGDHDVRVEYYESTGWAVTRLGWGCPVGQYQAQYLNNKVLSGSPVLARCEGAIDHMWGHGGPGSGVNTDNFSARWMGTHAFPGGTYTFTARTDDGIRVWVDGTLLIDAWKNQPATTYTATRTLSPGDHQIKVEYFEGTGWAVTRLNWAVT
jgi:hypothetical protein